MFEYPIFSPHGKAKLYKRYNDKMTVDIKEGESITFENNTYVMLGKFQWIETTSQEKNENQPIMGLPVAASYLTIKTNSRMKIDVGDIVSLPQNSHVGGKWIVTDGITIDYIYTPAAVQTYQHLPLEKMG